MQDGKFDSADTLDQKFSLGMWIYIIYSCLFVLWFQKTNSSQQWGGLHDCLCITPLLSTDSHSSIFLFHLHAMISFMILCVCDTLCVCYAPELWFLPSSSSLPQRESSYRTQAVTVGVWEMWYSWSVLQTGTASRSYGAAKVAALRQRRRSEATADSLSRPSDHTTGRCLRRHLPGAAPASAIPLPATIARRRCSDLPSRPLVCAAARPWRRNSVFLNFGRSSEVALLPCTLQLLVGPSVRFCSCWLGKYDSVWQYEQANNFKNLQHWLKGPILTVINAEPALSESKSSVATLQCQQCSNTAWLLPKRQNDEKLADL